MMDPGQPHQSITSIAPFQERAQPATGSSNAKVGRSTADASASHAPAGARAAGRLQRQHQHERSQQQHRREAEHQGPCGKPARGGVQAARASHASARIATAEAAVSAAAAAMAPSVRAPAPKSRAVAASSSTAQPRQQQGSAAGCAGATDAAADCPGNLDFSCSGRAALPPSSKPLKAAEPPAAASSTDSDTGWRLPQHQPPHQAASTHAELPEVHGTMLAQAAAQAAGSSGVEASAAAQLAAHGLHKRLRAQLRSRHGPPAFQRGPPPPRPASPPPVMLTGELLLQHTPGASETADVHAVDLSSRNISSIAAAAAGGSLVLSSGRGTFCMQQPCLQDFCSLLSLELSDNRLTCIAGLAVLTSLQQLAVSANRLRDLSGLAAVMGLQQLQGDASAGADALACTGSRPCSGGGSDDGSNGSSSSGGGSSGTGTGTGTGGQDRLAYAADADAATGSAVVQQHGEPGTAEGQQGGARGFIDDAQQEQRQQQEQRKQEQQVQEQQVQEQQQQEQLQLAAGTPAGPQANLLPPQLACSAFCSLAVLDVSYNMLSAAQLLGRKSPLGYLPRLSELHAAGNGISSLPAQLAAFAALSHLNLQHNRLPLAALCGLAQLPVLQTLEVSHNPLSGQPTEPCSFAALTILDVSSSSITTPQQLQPLLDSMAALQVLHLSGTPLAERCRAGKAQLQALQQAGVYIVFTDSPARQPHSSRSSSSRRRALMEPRLVVAVPEAAGPSTVMAAAASRAVLASLPHEQLVAAFERLGAGIDSWAALAPVPEEGSDAWEGGSMSQQGDEGGRDGAQAGPVDQAIEDRTFLTGVGITGELPSGQQCCPDRDGRQGAPACCTAGTSGSTTTHSHQLADQDPTERLAVALGLDVALLAHRSGRAPGAPDGALHRLRHALTHPLVDPGAGQRPEQHHMRLTAAAAAKQQPKQLLPLPQPIPVAVTTRVQQVQELDGVLRGMRGRLAELEGTLLQQLQAQANQLSGAAAPADVAAVPGIGQD